MSRSSDSPTILLIDGNALFFRAYHAFPKDLTTPAGEPIGAVYGFARILLSAIKTLRPTHFAVSFDLPGPTFRDKLYDQYKATRQKTPDDLSAQMPRAYEIVEKLEAPVYTAEGFEADDVIGTIAKQITTEHKTAKVIILSGDQDLLQLVNDRVFMYAPGIAPRFPVLYTPEKVKEKYGFEPIKMIDYKALRGDPSDNIKGVPGIGEVTAGKIITTFGGIEALYTALKAGKTDDLKPNLVDKLINHESDARLSYELAKISVEAPVTFNLLQSKLELQHPEHLVDLFSKLGFKSLMDELPGTHKLPAAVEDVFGNSSTKEEPLVKTESDEIDVAVAPILRSMEEHGVKVDLPYLKELEKEFDAQISLIRDKLHDLAGQPFNPDSPQQVSHILYEILHIPTAMIRKGKNGYTTDAATLTTLAKEHPIAAELLSYRELTKLQSTYVKPLQQLADDKQRVHTSYAPDTATGRISSKNPNLQNIPIRSEQGRRIRKAFIAEKGCVLVGADYSQMELRLAAHLSQDAEMIAAFQSGKDFHNETAERMHIDRATAKMINFSILYGKGAFGFSQDLGISIEEAKNYIEQYFKTYQGLRKYLDNVLELGRKNGYVETLYGRRRYLPDLTSSNFHRRSAAEREAVNMPIQGTQADIFKKAMHEVSAQLKKGNVQADLMLTVHDELVLEAKDSAAEVAGHLLVKAMEGAADLLVPLEVELKSGPNWTEMKPLSLT